MKVVSFLIPIYRIAIPRLEGQEFADLIANELMGEGDAGVESAHGSNLNMNFRVCTGDVTQPFAFADVDSHGLLDQDMLPGFQRPRSHRNVKLIGDRDNDGINILVR
ncbi:MAG TPA: hypothetical protein VIS96_05070 [Terrimicrobiaceae bacterium]